MKKSVVILLLLCVAGLGKAQEQETYYMFDEFQDAEVVYRNGRKTSAQINYSLLSSKFLFIDKNDKDEVKEIGNPEQIAVMRIGDRAFVPDPEGAIEVLMSDPFFRVQYNSVLLNTPKKQAAYGGESILTNTKTLSGLNSEGIYRHMEGDKAVLGRVNYTFILQRGDKNRTFTNKKQFLKVYPSSMKKELQEYMDTKQVDFRSIPDVLALVKYAESVVK